MHTNGVYYNKSDIAKVRAMIQNTSFIRVDPHGKELTDQRPLFPLVANDGDVHQYIAGCIPSHWHRDFELFVLMEGQVQVAVGDTVCTLAAGEGCFINSGALHSFTALTDTPCHYRSFVFDPSLVGGAPGSVFDALYVRPLMETGPTFWRFCPADAPAFFAPFERAFAACLSEAPAFEFRVRAALSELLVLILQASPSAPVRSWSTVQEQHLKQMLQFIDARRDTAIELVDIAHSANICPRECQRIFRQYLHCSPMSYLQNQRLFAAVADLASTDEPVTNIALAHGFSSPSYFSKQFRLLMGLTPTAYRQTAHHPPDTPVG